MNITLTPDIEQALVDEARRLGTTPEALALDSLRARFVVETSPHVSDDSQTMAEFLEGFIGVIDSEDVTPGGARMSERAHEKFAAGLQERGRKPR